MCRAACSCNWDLRADGAAWKDPPPGCSLLDARAEVVGKEDIAAAADGDRRPVLRCGQLVRTPVSTHSPARPVLDEEVEDAAVLIAWLVTAHCDVDVPCQIGGK